MRTACLASLFGLLAACSAPPPRSTHIAQASLSPANAADPQMFGDLRAAFVANNPGYDLRWYPAVRALAEAAADRVVFVQGPADRQAEPTVGDVLLVRAGERWDLQGDGALNLLAYSLPEPLPAALPAIIRPEPGERERQATEACVGITIASHITAHRPLPRRVSSPPSHARAQHPRSPARNNAAAPENHKTNNRQTIRLTIDKQPTDPPSLTEWCLRGD